METKTIEERAKEYAPDTFDNDYILPAREGYIVNLQRKAYIAGATEQKVIDDERAKNAFYKTCGWLSAYTWFNDLAKEYIKAMEE